MRWYGNHNIGYCGRDKWVNMEILKKLFDKGSIYSWILLVNLFKVFYWNLSWIFISLCFVILLIFFLKLENYLKIEIIELQVQNLNFAILLNFASYFFIEFSSWNFPHSTLAIVIKKWTNVDKIFFLLHTNKPKRSKKQLQ